eukprot:TRINITY_DN6356_c0_g2_i1.p1 TRINITY_DN6356_c0_g2~~TRINITY_DN6356_c0_g2_i1.p1  ORF type:complete len:235 (+),score=37.78 TRINITY_DN6356_c0_g2_i1:56-760(+)
MKQSNRTEKTNKNITSAKNKRKLHWSSTFDIYNRPTKRPRRELTFDQNSLIEFVSGMHKRKKARRKIATNELEATEKTLKRAFKAQVREEQDKLIRERQGNDDTSTSVPEIKRPCPDCPNTGNLYHTCNSWCWDNWTKQARTVEEVQVYSNGLQNITTTVVPVSSEKTSPPEVVTRIDAPMARVKREHKLETFKAWAPKEIEVKFRQTNLRRQRMLGNVPKKKKRKIDRKRKKR